MKPDFWHERWSSNQIAFHEAEVHPLLARHLPTLDLARGSRIFLPLCGKTVDIDWLREQGFRVAGAELSAIAVGQLFERLRLAPTITQAGELECWSAEGIDVFVGDLFGLTPVQLGEVDALYDRAALIALPEAMRRAYAVHLRALAPGAVTLLITIDYDAGAASGPPFPLVDAEVAALYPQVPRVVLERRDVPGGLRGRIPAVETAWRIGA